MTRARASLAGLACVAACMLAVNIPLTCWAGTMLGTSGLVAVMGVVGLVAILALARTIRAARWSIPMRSHRRSTVVVLALFSLSLAVLLAALLPGLIDGPAVVDGVPAWITPHRLIPLLLHTVMMFVAAGMLTAHAQRLVRERAHLLPQRLDGDISPKDRRLDPAME